MSTVSIYGENDSGTIETVKVFDRRLKVLGLDFLAAVAFGKIPGHSLVHKFGSNAAVGTSITVVSNGGYYQVPTAGVTLYATSTSANDTAGGSGAQEITVHYLDTNWVRQTGVIVMAGLSQSTTNIINAIRVTRAYVSKSGTYATATSPSQQGTITIHQDGGSPVFASMPELSAGFGSGQSIISVDTIPADHTAFMLKYIISADSNQTTDVYFFARRNADAVTAPYPGVMRIQNVYSGVNSTVGLDHQSWERYEEKTDMGFMAKVRSGTGTVSAEFEYLLVDNNYLQNV